MVIWNNLFDKKSAVALKNSGKYISCAAFDGFSVDQVYQALKSEFGPHMQTASSQQCGRCVLPFVPSLLKSIDNQLLSLMLLAFSYDFYVIDGTTKKPSEKRLRSRRTHQGKYRTANVQVDKATISIMIVCGQKGSGVDVVYSNASTHGSNILRDDNDSEYQDIGKHTTPCSVEQVRSQVKRQTLDAGKVYAMSGKTFMPEYPFSATKGATSPVCVLHFICMQANERTETNPFVLPSTSSALITRSVTRQHGGLQIAREELRLVIQKFDNMSTEESESVMHEYLHNSSRCYTALPEIGHDAAALQAELQVCPLHKGCDCLQNTSSMSLRQIIERRFFSKIDKRNCHKRKQDQLHAEVHALKAQLASAVRQNEEAQKALYIAGGPVWGGVVHEVKRQAISQKRIQQHVYSLTLKENEEIRLMLSDYMTQYELGKDANMQSCDVVCVQSLCGNIRFFNSPSITRWIMETGKIPKHSPEYKLAPKTPGASSTVPLSPEQVLCGISRHVSKFGMTLKDVCKTSKWVQQVQLYANPLTCPRASVRGTTRHEIVPDLQHWQREQNNVSVVNGVETLETPWRRVCKESLSVFVDEKRATEFLGPNITKEQAVEWTWCTKTNFMREIAAPAWKACEILEQVHEI